MESNIYGYGGKFQLEVIANKDYHALVRRNHEKIPINKMGNSGTLIVKQEKIREVKYYPEKPYIKIEESKDNGNNKFDYYRYGTLVRSIIKTSPTTYEARTWLKDDDPLFTRIFRNTFYESLESKKMSLLHASLLDVKGKGVLLVGRTWAGKTSLNVAFLSKIKGAKFVSEDDVFVSTDNGKMIGHYIPKSIYARFNIFNRHEGLRKVLRDISLLDAVQPFDIDTIKRVIRNKSYHIDLGLHLSRERFCDFLDAPSCPSSQISKILFIDYLKNDSPLIRELDPREAANRIKERERPKENGLNMIGKRDDPYLNSNSLLCSEVLEDIERVNVKYDSEKHLNISFLEDLL